MTCYLLILRACMLLSLFGKDDRPDLNVALISAEMKKDAYSVVRESVTTYEINSAKNYTCRVKESVTIMDKRSTYDILRVYYDQYSKARIVSASVYNQFGGLIRSIKKDEIEDVSVFDGVSLYSDNRRLDVKLIGGSYPYSVAYEYEIQYSATRYYPDWDAQYYFTSIENAELNIIHPQALEIAAKSMNGVVLDIDTINAQGMHNRKWTVEGLIAIRYEEFNPPSYALLPAVLIAPSRFEVEQYTGTMKDWKSFGKFIYDLNLGREKLTPSMAARVQQLISGINGDSAKIEVLYDFLKSNMRYVSVQLGIGGWQTYDAVYVEKNKYGDCKALSYFMKGMLAEAGIESYPVLVPMDMPSLFVDDFVTPGSFNHMMLYAPTQDLWLECTSNLNPTGYIYDVTSDRDVLVITPEGGVKARTPARAIEQSSVITTDTIHLHDGKWKMHGTHVYVSGTHDRVRYIQKDMAQTEQEKLFREEFALSIAELESLHYSVETHEPVATCAFQVTLAQYGSVSGNRIFIPVNPLYRFESPCISETRIHDIYREYPIIERNTTRFEIPEGYQIESIPAAKSAEDPRFGSFDLQVIQHGNVIMIERSLRIPRMQLQAEVYSEMCAFNKSIETADRGTLVLRKTGP